MALSGNREPGQCSASLPTVATSGHRVYASVCSPTLPQAATQASPRPGGEPELALAKCEMEPGEVSRALKTQPLSRAFLVFSSQVRSPVEPLDSTSRGQKHFIRQCLYQKCLKNKSFPRAHGETGTGVTCRCTSRTSSVKRSVSAIFQKRKTLQ